MDVDDGLFMILMLSVSLAIVTFTIIGGYSLITDIEIKKQNNSCLMIADV